MSKKRTSIKDNSPLTGLISEPEPVGADEEVVTPSSRQTVRQSNPPASGQNEIQQETLYLHSEQVIELEDLVLQMKRRSPRIKTSKSALARVAIALLLEKNPEEIAALLS